MSKINQLNLRKKAAYLSLAVGIGMFIIKMTAYYITGSVAIFSDATESVVHVAATAMLCSALSLVLNQQMRLTFTDMEILNIFLPELKGF